MKYISDDDSNDSSIRNFINDGSISESSWSHSPGGNTPSPGGDKQKKFPSVSVKMERDRKVSMLMNCLPGCNVNEWFKSVHQYLHTFFFLFEAQTQHQWLID